MRLSVALATHNEEAFLEDCLKSVAPIASEINIVDGSSTDTTLEIAKKYHANIIVATNPPNFHINKQKALDMCRGEWMLQMDADERLTPALQEEIKKITTMTTEEVEKYQLSFPQELRALFLRHQKLLDDRDGKIGQDSGPFTAFFLPRLSYFLGRYMRYGGVYPDGAIRLVKNKAGHFPCKSVHEQMTIKGRVGWLKNNELHVPDKTFARYLERFNRYTDLEAKTVSGGFLANLVIKPLTDRNQGFLTLYFRHKGYLEGFPGFVWALFSALHFPIAYFKSLDIKAGRVK